MAAGREPSFFWDKFIPFFYGLGAAVVILGAMGKIMHYDWANIALPVGLGTEALIFVIYALQAFLRPDEEYQWEKVYPELNPGFQGELPKARPTASANMGLTTKMDDMLGSSGLGADVFDKLKNSFGKLSDTVSNLGDISNATVATNQYTTNMNAAAGKVSELGSAYGAASTALNSMASATKDAEEYRSQFQKINQNMGALNAVYELELQDTNKHLKSMNNFYGSLSSAMEDMSAASADTQNFKQELSKLTSNLESLNDVYGNMLSAMKN